MSLPDFTLQGNANQLLPFRGGKGEVVNDYVD